MLYIQRGSSFLFGCYHFEIVQLHPVLPARIGHEGWGARTSEELSVGSFVCEYAGAMAIPNIQVVKINIPWWQLKYFLYV